MNKNKHVETQTIAWSDINHYKKSVKNIPLTGVYQNISAVHHCMATVQMETERATASTANLTQL